MHEPRKHPNERRFASSVRAKQEQTLAGLDLEIHV